MKNLIHTGIQRWQAWTPVIKTVYACTLLLYYINSGYVLECSDKHTSHCVTSIHTLMLTILSCIHLYFTQYYYSV